MPQSAFKMILYKDCELELGVLSQPNVVGMSLVSVWKLPDNREASQIWNPSMSWVEQTFRHLAWWTGTTVLPCLVFFEVESQGKQTWEQRASADWYFCQNWRPSKNVNVHLQASFASFMAKPWMFYFEVTGRPSQFAGPVSYVEFPQFLDPETETGLCTSCTWPGESWETLSCTSH